MPLCKEHKQWHQCATYKICSVLFGMLSLCCLVSSVVDHMLLISGGFLMVVHRLFWGYSLVTLCYFVMGGTASGSCCFVSSVAFLLFFCFFVVYIQDIIIPLDVV